MKPPPDNWVGLAGHFGIRLPEGFLGLVECGEMKTGGWRLLHPREALSLKAELDARYAYPGREWRGLPFARSAASEDVACFDLDSGSRDEALVLPIRDWHGPRWEFSGDRRTFRQWLSSDREGHFS